jgi:amino acid permease
MAGRTLTNVNPTLVHVNPTIKEEQTKLLGGGSIGYGTAVDETQEEDSTLKWLGGKNITFCGSVVLNTNGAIGPGVLALPYVFQEAGWLFCTTVCIFMGLVTALCGMFLCDSIARVPGNSEFTKRVEYEAVFSIFLGHRWGLVAQFLFIVCLMSQLISTIVETAQGSDAFLAYLFGTSHGVELFPVMSVKSMGGDCNVTLADDCVKLSDPLDNSIIFSLGYILVAVLILPMCFMNLDDNMSYQFGSFSATLIFIAVFFVDWVEDLDVGRVPMIGGSFGRALGIIVFNYGSVMFLPSWVNEKQLGVDVKSTIQITCTFTTGLFILIGVLGGLGIPDANSNLLADMISERFPGYIRVCGMLFGVLTIGLGIPLYCIMIRYNLLQISESVPQVVPSSVASETSVGGGEGSAGGGEGSVGGAGGSPGTPNGCIPNGCLGGSESDELSLQGCLRSHSQMKLSCSPGYALMWSTVLPWGVGWMLMRGEMVETMMELTGITTNAFINFIAPLILYWTILGLYGQAQTDRRLRGESHWPPRGSEEEEEEEEEVATGAGGGGAAIVPGPGVVHPFSMFLPAASPSSPDSRHEPCCNEVRLGRGIAIGLAVVLVPVFGFALWATVTHWFGNPQPE